MSETIIRVPHDPDEPIRVLEGENTISGTVTEVSGEIALREILHDAITRRLTNLNNRQTARNKGLTGFRD